MSVSLRPRQLAGGEGVERDQRDGHAMAGSGEPSASRIGFGVEGERDGGVDRGEAHAPGGVGEDQFAGLQHFEQRAQPVLGPVAV